MRSFIAALTFACLAISGSPAARADTVNVNSTAFPLPSNQLFPARSNRLLLKCYNPPGNGTAVVTYASGFTFSMIGGAALWETQRIPSGAITATGTAGNVLSCEEVYQ